jgi:phytol kinase
MNSWLNTFYLSVAFLVLFALAEILFHFAKVKVEITRKFVHLSSGILTLTFPLWLDSHWQVLVLCTAFAVLLLASKSFGFLKSVNGVDRHTHGSVLFPLSVYLCFHLCIYYGSLIFFYAPMLVLAISDPLAALFGKRWPKGKYKFFSETKTLVGSSAFYFSAFITVFCLLLYFIPSLSALHLIILSAMISFFATLSEALSVKGFDNLFIPLTVAGVLLLYFSLTMIQL